MSTVVEEKKENNFVLTDLIGCKARTPTGETISIGKDWAEKDVIAFYFSAHWFTPQLAAAYKEYKEKDPNDNKFELVFVSSDSDEDTFKEYHGQMTFPALDYNEIQGSIKGELDKKFKVDGIPFLAVMDAKTGELLFDEEVEEEDKWPLSPREMITQYSSMAFPLSKETSQRCVDHSNYQQLAATQKIVSLGNILLPPRLDKTDESTDTYTFASLLDSYDFVGLMLGSKLCLEDLLPAIARVFQEANADEDGKSCKRIAAVYVPDCFPEFDEYAKKPYKEGHIKGLFHFQEHPSQETIDLLKATAGAETNITLVIVKQEMKQVQECGMDGKCGSTQVKETKIVAADTWAANTAKYGAKYLPWDKDLVDQAVAEEKALARENRMKIEGNLEPFLLELASEGKLVVGDDKVSADAVSRRFQELDDEEGLVILYFGDRPANLMETYENVNNGLTTSGKKKLEIVFAREHSHEAAFQARYGTMATPVTKVRPMAIHFPHRLLCRSIRAAFSEDPTDPPFLVLLKKDGTVVSSEDMVALQIEETSHWGFPWTEEAVARGRDKTIALAKEEEERIESIQKERNVPVVKRLIADSRWVKYCPDERVIRPQLNARFSTFGMPETIITGDAESNYNPCMETGVFYYEIELLKVGEWAHAAQFGFCKPGALDALVAQQSTGAGNGDTEDSWGVCGLRGELWANRQASPWPNAPRLKTGDVVRLAVSATDGKIAVAINGGNFTVVFEDEHIKLDGVFPCFSFDSDLEIRVNATNETFKHSGPPDETWLQSPPSKHHQKEEKDEEKKKD